MHAPARQAARVQQQDARDDTHGAGASADGVCREDGVHLVGGTTSPHSGGGCDYNMREQGSEGGVRGVASEDTENEVGGKLRGGGGGGGWGKGVGSKDLQGDGGEDTRRGGSVGGMESFWALKQLRGKQEVECVWECLGVAETAQARPLLLLLQLSTLLLLPPRPPLLLRCYPFLLEVKQRRHPYQFWCAENP